MNRKKGESTDTGMDGWTAKMGGWMDRQMEE